MKKNILFVLIVTIILLAALFLCSRFCRTDRYVVVFGNIQEHYSQVLTPEQTGEKHVRSDAEDKIVPVCVKIDTLTGRTWIYKYSFFVGANGYIMENNEFEEIKAKNRGWW